MTYYSLNKTGCIQHNYSLILRIFNYNRNAKEELLTFYRRKIKKITSFIKQKIPNITIFSGNSTNFVERYKNSTQSQRTYKTLSTAQTYELPMNIDVVLSDSIKLRLLFLPPSRLHNPHRNPSRKIQGRREKRAPA